MFRTVHQEVALVGQGCLGQGVCQVTAPGVKLLFTIAGLFTVEHD